MHTTLLILAAVVMAFTAIAMWLDLKTRKLPNWLTVPTFAAALVFHTVTGGLSGLGFAMGGFAVGFGLLLVLWLIGGGGGGDVKMMGALGAWLGGPLTIIVFLGSGLFALAGMVLLMTWRMLSRALGPRDVGTRGDEETNDAEAARQMIPYAVPATLATWTVMGMKLFTAFATTGGN